MKASKKNLMLLYLCLLQARRIIRFRHLARSLPQICREADQGDISAFVSPAWQKVNAALLDKMRRGLRLGFLREQLVGDTMVFTLKRGLAPELEFLESTSGDAQLRSLLREDAAGLPEVISRRYLTSLNRIHHTYHLKRYLAHTGIDPASIDCIVEWGGGYGDLARICRRLFGSGNTYIIIDTPFFCAVQYVYLSSVSGNAPVKICLPGNGGILKGGVNIVPLGMIESLQIPRPDLFISTWALSESTGFAQEYVDTKLQFTAAKRYLLAFQKNSATFTTAERTGEFATQSGGSILPISFLEGNFYAFK
jgi:hypothetical protein